MGRIILSRNPPSAVLVLAILVRGFAFGFSVAGLEPPGIDARPGFAFRCDRVDGPFSLATEAMFTGLRSPVDGAVPSSLATEAAVGAVADAGSFTGRVGDLALGLVNAEADGDEGPVFLVGGFALDVVGDGADFGADVA